MVAHEKITGFLMFVAGVLLIAGLAYDVYGSQKIELAVFGAGGESVEQLFGFRQYFDEDKDNEEAYGDCEQVVDSGNGKIVSSIIQSEAFQKALEAKGNKMVKATEEPDPKALCEALRDSGATAFAFAFLATLTAFAATGLLFMKKSGAMATTACTFLFALIAFAVWIGVGYTELTDFADALVLQLAQPGLSVTITSSVGASVALYAYVFVHTFLTSIYVCIAGKKGSITL
eukprot:TRINITY_DN3_c0_g1_i2.p1 TRINITY_DN3_c0_g1~~TRINITY_DN3_c0_g1_i2.p1  ORF type:complete len:231 (-),score=65.62 TRINITY_DN3_c0_g1_i2:191-883(-)